MANTAQGRLRQPTSEHCPVTAKGSHAAGPPLDALRTTKARQHVTPAMRTAGRARRITKLQEIGYMSGPQRLNSAHRRFMSNPRPICPRDSSLLYCTQATMARLGHVSAIKSVINCAQRELVNVCRKWSQEKEPVGRPLVCSHRWLGRA